MKFHNFKFILLQRSVASVNRSTLCYSQEARQKSWKPNAKLEAAIEEHENLKRRASRENFGKDTLFTPRELKKLSRAEQALYVKPKEKIEIPGTAELVREYIHRSLYDEKMGYFSKEAVIWTPQKKYAMKDFYDTAAFQRQMQLDLSNWCQDYTRNQVVVKSQSQIKDVQAWYTASELFKPHYGIAIAKYLLAQTPSDQPIIIYDMGGGGASMMVSILNFLRDKHPKRYATSQYYMLEISSRMAAKQRHQISHHQHQNHCQVHLANAFTYPHVDRRYCWILAFELIDNFAHDVVKHNFNVKPDEVEGSADCYNKDVFEGHAYKVELDNERKKYSELYFPLQDALIKDYIKVRAAVGKHPVYAQPNYVNKMLLAMTSMFNKKPFLGAKEWLPTTTFAWMRHLHRTWPQHRLILADFDDLPHLVEGYNSPVVQSRFKGDTYQCTQYLVKEGLFDIFFRTDFETLALIYQFLKQFDFARQSPTLGWPTAEQLKDFMNKVPASLRSHPTAGHRPPHSTLPKVLKQSDFIKTWADLGPCRTRSGQIPMMDFYENISMLLT